MIDSEILTGASRQWRLLKLIAQGDAGELYLVESIRDGCIGILKRPGQSNFAADIHRQSRQIDREVNLIKALRDLRIDNTGFTIKVISLLDQSLPGTETTSQYFIVLEKATGISLSSLARIARIGLDNPDLKLLDFSQELLPFVQTLEQNHSIPALVMVRSIKGLLDLFETIHTLKINRFEGEISGVLWNDVKPDHVFWDPAQAVFTIIDWSNGQFLDKDGISQDRQFSVGSDYRQFFEEIGRLLSDLSSDLYEKLSWSEYTNVTEGNAPELRRLKEKITHQIQKETALLLEARQRERYILSMGAPNIDKLHELSTAQTRILSFGELPDYQIADELHRRSAALLASQGNLVGLIQICQHALESLPLQKSTWKVLENLATLTAQKTSASSALFLDALRAAIIGDWPEAHWLLCQGCVKSQEQERWPQLSAQIRGMVPEIADGNPLPYRAATRLLHGLEDEYRRLANQPVGSSAPENGIANQRQADLKQLAHQLDVLRNELLTKWTEIDPPPPGSDLSYSQMDSFLLGLHETLSNLGIDPNIKLNPLRQALSQPKAQTAILLDTWNAKGFQTALRSLRNLLLWDPDRLRVLRAEQAIKKAPGWLEELRRGPKKKEKVLEYAIRMEHAGRLLRGQVGQAPWIDPALALFSRLRNGARPSDLIAEIPDIVGDFPWLKYFEPRPILAPEPKAPIFGNSVSPHTQHTSLVKEGNFGQGQDILLGEPLDSWVPEARGSSARVFAGTIRLTNGTSKQVAIKIIRPDKIDYALPLFAEEVRVLSVVGDLPGVSPWLECGFLYLDEGLRLPSDVSSMSANDLSGKIIRYGTREASNFLEELGPRTESGWLPYLALEQRPQGDCLLLFCDEGQTKGRYLPVEIGLQMAIQICDILSSIHARNIVYRDHKILHYYWDVIHKKISVIDWNVAKWHPDGVSHDEIHADLVQFGARALHHILTGRPAPGALPVGPTRPDEIELAPQSYLPAWTYDDSQRLSKELQNILSALLSGQYSSASQLREDLLLQLSFANQLKDFS
jgi:serine/threonine protein kinase